MMKTKGWIILWFGIVIGLLAWIGMTVHHVDPFFHYHAPYTDTYFYSLGNQRSQNDGISKHFTYDAVITGTSMTENFKTSEIDELFGVSSVKVPFSGATYREINDNLEVALRYNENCNMVIRALDAGHFLDTADVMRLDMGAYPTYLYDANPFNDVKYIYNKDIIFNNVYNMILATKEEDFEPGITSFDVYSNWQNGYTFGVESVAPDGVHFDGAKDAVHLTDEQREDIYENITENVTNLADEYPDANFYYFITPYSVLWYMDLVQDGTIYQLLEAERYIIELILPHENIRLYFFSTEEDIVTDINNYKDKIHYAAWINSYIAHMILEDQHRLTVDNYEDYLEAEYDLFLNFEYESLNDQEDYEDDHYVAALWNEKIWGVEPIEVAETYSEETLTLDSIGKHNYLAFYTAGTAGDDTAQVLAFDNAGNLLDEEQLGAVEMNEERHLHVLDLSGTEGDVTITFPVSTTNTYVFENLILY